MRWLRDIFDRFTLGAVVLTFGVGWFFWHVHLDDRREEKVIAQESSFRRWWQTAVWPPDGQPGFGPPLSGDPGAAVRFRSYDWLFLLRQRIVPQTPPKEAMIVYMDEQSYDVFNQALNEPWDRRLHAQLLRRLLNAGVRAVVFDIVLAEQRRFTDPEGDQALAEVAALATNRLVVAVSTKPDPSHPRVPGAIPPYESLVAAMAQDARSEITEWNLFLGMPEVEPSFDEIVRQFPPSYPPYKHSMYWAVSSLLQVPLTANPGSEACQQAETAERWLNYYGPAYSLDHMTYQEALSPETSDQRFQDRVVFIGSSTLTKFANERKDSYISPFAVLGRDKERFITGVEIHTTATLNLIRSEWLTRVNVRTEMLAFLGLGLVVAVGLQRLRAIASTVCAALLVILITAAAWYFFYYHRLWFAWLIPITQVGVAWFYSLTVNSVRLFLQNQLYQQSLALYLSPKLVKKFASDKEQKFLKPGADKTLLTIFFSDIAGFTTISEGLDSDDLARTMNQYFQTAVGQCIHATDGTVVKYIGDAIFAFWNAPDLQSDHADRACEAALRFRLQTIQEVNGHRMITRIGLHTGVANVGNFGSTQRVDYTALGENINLASRMEGLNKYLGTETLITGETHRYVEGRFLTRPLGHFILKGFEKKRVEVHELLGRPAQAEEFHRLHSLFAGALEVFRTGDIEAAEAAFRGVREQFPNDGPTQFYLKALAELRGHPPGPGWDGAVELKEK